MAPPMNSTRTDVDNPNTWKRFSPNLCTGCQALCCHLIIEVTAEDLIRLGITDEEEVNLDLKALVKRLKQDKVILRCNLARKKFTLAPKKKGGCQFLDDDNLCTVYEDRPGVCRSHPVILSPRLGYCPWSPAR